jgi:outer membrane protein assembly factor BamB
MDKSGTVRARTGGVNQMAEARFPSAGTSRAWVKRLGRWLLVLLVLVWLSAIGLAVAVNLIGRLGSDVRLLVTSGVVIFTCVLSLAWFVVFGPVSRRLRLAIAGGTLGLCLLFAALFRLEEVTAGMVPRFVFRWSGATTPQLDSLPLPSENIQPSIDLVTTSNDDYPCFLGRNQTLGVDGVQFETNWSQTPPRCVWRRPIGAGWSGFVAVNGYAITQEQRDTQELVTCYEIRTGRPVWASAISARHETKMGGVGPRSTPCIDEGRVYSLGATGVFRCLDGATGRELWRHDLLAEFAVTDELETIAWGRSGSPLIVDRAVVIPAGGGTPGSVASLVAYDKITGDELWRAGNRQISYASPQRATLLGQDQILVVLQDFVCGFDSSTGQLLWEFEWPGRSNANASVSNAVPLDDRHVFLSKGYAQGAELIELARGPDGAWGASSAWKKHEIMKTKISNVVVFEGHIYGLDDVVLECIDWRTGQRRWKRGRFGYGQLLRAGTTLIVQSESGDLAAIEASPDSFVELGRFTAMDGKCWAHLCLSGPYLLLRNATEAACFELPNWRHNPSPNVDATAANSMSAVTSD